MGELVKSPGLFEWLTLLAIGAGPIFAVFVTRYVDARREASSRKLDVFRTLMRTRRSPTSQEHVGALNLIEIEFRGIPLVMEKWRDLLKHFATEHVRRSDERYESVAAPEEKGTKDERFYRRLGEERQKLLALLLHAMAGKLKFKAEQLEIFEGGYLPQGWVDLELEQNVLRRFLMDLSTARRVLPVGVLYSAPMNTGTENNDSTTTPVEGELAKDA